MAITLEESARYCRELRHVSRCPECGAWCWDAVCHACGHGERR